MLKHLLLAFAFLTRIPIKIETVEEKDLGKAVVFFPVVGAFEGSVCALSIYLLYSYLPPDLLSALSLVVLFLIRGIFHLDGLSDTFDAFSIKSSGNKEKDIQKRLQIMKDSTVGVGGVWAVVMDILFKFLLIKNLSAEKDVFFPLIVAYSFSRWLITLAMFKGKPARNTGLGYVLIKNFTFTEFLFSSLIFFIIVFPFLACISFYKIQITFVIIFLLILMSFSFKKICKNFFGGLTGDTLGALVEISEILFLFFYTIMF